jgi:hypothetical protein
MRQDIKLGYPNDYYQLRRKVTQEIREQLENWVIRASTENPATKAEIEEYVRELSLRSGIPEKGVQRLFTSINGKTSAWFE